MVYWATTGLKVSGLYFLAETMKFSINAQLVLVTPNIVKSSKHIGKNY